MGLTTSERDSDFFIDVKDTTAYEHQLIADLHNGLYEPPVEVEAQQGRTVTVIPFLIITPFLLITLLPYYLPLPYYDIFPSFLSLSSPFTLSPFPCYHPPFCPFLLSSPSSLLLSPLSHIITLISLFRYSLFFVTHPHATHHLPSLQWKKRKYGEVPNDPVSGVLFVLPLLWAVAPRGDPVAITV